MDPTSIHDQYLYIELQDDISNADFIKKMTDLHPKVRIVRLIRKKEEIELQENETHITDLSALNVFTEIYRHETGKEPSEDVLELFFGDQRLLKNRFLFSNQSIIKYPYIKQNENTRCQNSKSSISEGNI